MVLSVTWSDASAVEDAAALACAGETLLAGSLAGTAPPVAEFPAMTQSVTVRELSPVLRWRLPRRCRQDNAT